MNHENFLEFFITAKVVSHSRCFCDSITHQIDQIDEGK